MRQINTLTGLRFLAALYVFIFHINLPFRTPLTYLPSPLRTLIAQGSLGVTIFFVLSGFVLTYSHLKDYREPNIKPFSYTLHFMFKRLARIYPVFFVGLLGCVLISLRTSTLPEWWLMLMSATFTQTYFPSISMTWYDSGAWSVANEIFFYLLFPVLLPLALRIRSRNELGQRTSRNVFLVLASLILLDGVLGLVFQLHPAWNLQFMYSFPPSRLVEFVAGILIGLLVIKYQWKMPAWSAVVALGLTAVYLVFAAPHTQERNSIHHLVLLPTLAILFSVLYQPKQSPLFAWLGSRPLRYLGATSYSFYIAQIPLLFVLAALLGGGYIQHDNWLVLPVGFVINLVSAILLHEFVEVTVHRAAMTWYKKRWS
ncbi:acyltransferase [Hymenobacter ginsengisoli]|uniref:Acyltransferase n=1 Tax=Hymenobacter ginsengisoli TaxID=1051626 RepID=A0ABP8Q1F6_9BACT|nr:acyltransferase [Hymenobacter sp. KCTC 23674]MBO2033668.1 acyltransferase [Hymenobacter sp. BT559]